MKADCHCMPEACPEASVRVQLDHRGAAAEPTFAPQGQCPHCKSGRFPGQRQAERETLTRNPLDDDVCKR